jgi:hypothetical protein
MKFARLLMAAAASLAAGAVAQYISRANRWVPYIVGGIVLAMFVPVHFAIWTRLPVWYHMTFLLTIVPMVILGGQLVPKNRSANLKSAVTQLGQLVWYCCSKINGRQLVVATDVLPRLCESDLSASAGRQAEPHEH